MKKITCVYTGLGGLVESVEKIFTETCGEVRFHHILDSGLISDIVEAGGITPRLEERIYALFDAASATDADVIVSTCSSLGDVAEKYAAEHPELKILRIDYPMAKYAAENGKKVSVLSTLSTTAGPSVGLVQSLARAAGREAELEVVQATVPGAFDAMRSGNLEKATELVEETAKKLCAGSDIVLLAQASMSVFKQTLKETLGEGTEIMESPASCAAYLKRNIF